MRLYCVQAEVKLLEYLVMIPNTLQKLDAYYSVDTVLIKTMIIIKHKYG